MSRFASNLHHRDPRSQLFEGYNPPSSSSSSSGPPTTTAYNSYAYPSTPPSRPSSGFRSATPNSRGQYSDATLNELESQNNAEIPLILGKVKILKDLGVAMGVEIKEGSVLADRLNEQMGGMQRRVKGAMTRMKVMAQKSGVGWKVWVGFFATVIFLFFWVWI